MYIRQIDDDFLEIYLLAPKGVGRIYEKQV